MNKKLYVGNLLYEATEDQLRDHFGQAGTVTSAQIIRFADSGRSKGFGFIEFESEEDAQKAIEMFHEQDFMGRKIIVNEARPKRENGGGGGGGRFRGDNRRFGGGGGGRDRFKRNGGDRNYTDVNDMGMDPMDQ